MLQEQLKSYDSAINKAGILISISALLIPIAVTFISSSDSSTVIKYLIILPTVLMIIALIYLLRVLMPKGLEHGFNFSQFDKQINKTHKEVLLYEIGANSDSYSDNIIIVRRQNRNFKSGIKLIFSSAILIFVFVTVSMFVSETDTKEKLIKKATIEQLDINKLNIKTMCDSNSNSDSNTDNNQEQQTQESTQESTSIPNVPREERANIEKSENSDSLTKK